MREKEGYRDALGRIREKSEAEFLTVSEVASITGYCKRTVTRKFYGWTGNTTDKRIAATTLARQMC